MKTSTFALKHRLRVRRDECGDEIIPGKFGQIYEYAKGLFAVMYMPDPEGKRPAKSKQWTNRRNWMLAAGFKILQDCDGEGTASFDPHDQQQVNLAIRVAGIKRRRVLSEEQRELKIQALEKARAISRFHRNPVPEGGLEPKKRLRGVG